MSTYPTDPTPMSDDPEVLRRQIEQTRSDLSRDVDALGEAASPGNVARRQAEKVSETVTGAGRSLKEKVMGSDDPGSGPGMGSAPPTPPPTWANGWVRSPGRPATRWRRPRPRPAGRPGATRWRPD